MVQKGNLLYHFLHFFLMGLGTRVREVLAFSLIPRFLPRKMGKDLRRFEQVPREVACVVLTIELLPTQSESKCCPAAM